MENLLVQTKKEKIPEFLHSPRIYSRNGWIPENLIDVRSILAIFPFRFNSFTSWSEPDNVEVHHIRPPTAPRSDQIIIHILSGASSLTNGRGQLYMRDVGSSPPGNDDRRDGRQYRGKIPGYRGDRLGAPEYPPDLPGVPRRGKPGRPGPHGPWRRKRRPGRHLGDEPCRMGDRPVRHLEDRARSW